VRANSSPKRLAHEIDNLLGRPLCRGTEQRFNRILILIIEKMRVSRNWFAVEVDFRTTTGSLLSG